jgi:hypothetical protein
MGTTGSSSGLHIHFEVRTTDGQTLDPNDFKLGSNAILPSKINGLPNFLGVSTEGPLDYDEGDTIQLTNATPSTLDKGIYKINSPVVDSRTVVVKNTASTPKFYIDTNNNNIFDVGEQELGSDILSASFSQDEALQDVSLSQTWNLVSFNATNDITLTTKDVADQAALTGLKMEMASYDTDKWTISAIKKEGNINAFYGNQYNLVPGHAFFLKTDSEGIYYNSGQIFNNVSKELALNIGWNFFSFSKDVIGSTSLTSYTLLDKCKATGITCTLFSDYNGQLENTVLVKDIYFGKDYPLITNKGYILKVESNPGTIKF